MSDERTRDQDAGLMVFLAFKWYGTPYLWGGDDFSGFDCSGLVIECLQSVGCLPRGDWTADALMRRYEDCAVELPYKGCLGFRVGQDGKARHVEIFINNTHTIGASGGDSRTVDMEAAIRQNAYIKVRPYSWSGLNHFADPLAPGAPRG